MKVALFDWLRACPFIWQQRWVGAREGVIHSRHVCVLHVLCTRRKATSLVEVPDAIHPHVHTCKGAPRGGEGVCGSGAAVGAAGCAHQQRGDEQGATHVSDFVGANRCVLVRERVCTCMGRMHGLCIVEEVGKGRWQRGMLLKRRCW